MPLRLRAEHRDHVDLVQPAEVGLHGGRGREQVLQDPAELDVAGEVAGGVRRGVVVWNMKMLNGFRTVKLTYLDYRSCLAGGRLL